MENKQIFTHYDEHLSTPHNVSFVADFAAHMIERWGMVAAIEDGEDSAGRAKCRLATPEELVDRAFKTAELYISLALADGHIKDLGPLTERKFLMQSYDAWRLTPVKTTTGDEDMVERLERSRRAKTE